MSRSKKSLKQKLAMALSVINTLNVCAPIALPYVNVARDMSTGGGARQAAERRPYRDLQHGPLPLRHSAGDRL